MQELPKESIERLSRVTKLLSTQRTLPARLEAVASIVKRIVPTCDAVGLSLLVDGQPTTAAVSDRLAVEIDLIQYETGEGPCLSAIRDSNVIRIDLIERDRRYSRFAPGAIAHDINSVLSLPLTVGGRTVGALNLYSHAAGAFDARTEEVLRPLVDYAAEVVSTSPLYAYSLELVEGLVEDLESRAMISQAMGIIIANEGCTQEQALDRLRELALASGEPIRSVAEWAIVERPNGAATLEPGRMTQSNDLRPK